MIKQKTAPEVVYKALADRQRLRILCVLLDGSMCVGDLIEVLDLPQPTVSRNLGILKRAGLIQSKKAGQWAFYSLNEQGDRFQEQILNSIQLCGEEDAHCVRVRQAAMELRQNGGCCPKTNPDIDPCCGPKTRGCDG